jgi:hypothetical protein
MRKPWWHCTRCRKRYWWFRRSCAPCLEIAARAFEQGRKFRRAVWLHVEGDELHATPCGREDLN